MMDRKDFAMRNQRSFSLEFKKQVTEELLSGESQPAQLCRRYNISSSLLYHWKRQQLAGLRNAYNLVYLRTKRLRFVSKMLAILPSKDILG